MPFVEIRARGEEDDFIPWDGESMGELEVRGPWVASSYYEAPEGDDKFTDDGWFRTGDIVTIDKYGFINITDRAKDLIKSGGEWISSVELENALMAHDAVSQAAVISIPHEKWDERPSGGHSAERRQRSKRRRATPAPGERTSPSSGSRTPTSSSSRSR